MAIKKTFVVTVHQPDRSIDSFKYKTATRAEATRLAERDHPEGYITQTNRLNQERLELHGLFKTDDLTLHRSNATGQFRFQHKGKKRRGMKNYPTPKRGWRKLYPPVIFTWIETYAPPVSDFMKDWIGLLVKKPEEETICAST